MAFSDCQMAKKVEIIDGMCTPFPRKVCTALFVELFSDKSNSNFNSEDDSNIWWKLNPRILRVNVVQPASSRSAFHTMEGVGNRDYS